MRKADTSLLVSDIDGGQAERLNDRHETDGKEDRVNKSRASRQQRTGKLCRSSLALYANGFFSSDQSDDEWTFFYSNLNA